MDLAKLGKKAIFIPTPGQTEQEYLAKHHSLISNIKWTNQDNFILNGKNNFGKIYSHNNNNLLQKEISKIGL
jgi:hypothetical protein